MVENYKFSVGYPRLMHTVSSSSSLATSIYLRKSDHATSTINFILESSKLSFRSKLILYTHLSIKIAVS